MSAPTRFVTPALPHSRPHRRRRRSRRLWRATLGRVRFERRDVVVMVALLLLAALLLATRFSDRFFDRLIQRPADALAPSAEVSQGIP